MSKKEITKRWRGVEEKRTAGHALIENQETLKDLQLVLVQYRTSDLVVQLLVREGLFGLKTLEGKRRPSISKMTSRY